MLSGLAGAAPASWSRRRARGAAARAHRVRPPRPRPALVVLVTSDGQRVENRVIEVAGGPARLRPPQRASNYLNAKLSGRTLEEAKAEVAEEDLRQPRTALDALTHQVIEAGLGTWSGGVGGGGSLILRGQAKLLQNLDQLARVGQEKIQALFDRLEAQETSCCAWWTWPSAARACRSSSVPRAGCSTPAGLVDGGGALPQRGRSGSWARSG